MDPLTIWCNTPLTPEVRRHLEEGIAAVGAANGHAHRLIFEPQADPARADLGSVDVAFGQPDLAPVLASGRVRWVQVSTAGYTRFDPPDVRRVFRDRALALTTSSTVFAEPCAQHVLGMILAQARQLPTALANQAWPRAWPQTAVRAGSHLIEAQRVLIVGYGAIAARLVEFLGPFHLTIDGLRRSPRGDESIPVHPLEAFPLLLPEADHVINILPASADTDLFFRADEFARMKQGAVFYNIGRGSTVDQEALTAALNRHQLRAAWLDVTDPEPLPPEHPLWTTPNCYITPHAAGGHDTEATRLVVHFLANLRRFSQAEPLLDRVL